MAAAQDIVSRSELLYRVDAGRIAAWKPNPTAYRFGYLWTVHRLYYWHRDHERIVKRKHHVCLNNLMDPFEISFGIPIDSPALRPVRRLTELLIGRDTADKCFSTPAARAGRVLLANLGFYV
jgi:hypothetical protein